MNQEKIGKFIAMLRKEKGLTQEILAEKLGVSINAVSKWERGICLMDISLLKPLSKILDVSITEILNGEKIESTDTSLKTEEIIEKTIDYSSKEIKKAKKMKTLKIISIITISSLILSFIIFTIFKQNNYNIYDNIDGLGFISIDVSNLDNDITSLNLQKGIEIDIKVKNPNNDNNDLFDLPLLSNVVVTKLRNAKFEETINTNDIKYIEVLVPKEYRKITEIIFMFFNQTINISENQTNKKNLNVGAINTELYNFIQKNYIHEITANEYQ